MLNVGTKVRVLKGKFRDEFGTVTNVRTDKNGVTRTHVALAAGVFSYMPTSILESTTAIAAASINATL